MMTVKIVTIVLFIASCALFWLWLKVEKAEERNRKLIAENAQKQAEIQAQKTEIKNVQIKQKNHDDVKRSDASVVDQQLHANGYFRDDDRLHGVRADLPKSSGYDGDEASSAGTQSDL